MGFVSREVWGRVVFLWSGRVKPLKVDRVWPLGSEEDIRVCVSFIVGEHDSFDLFRLFF